MRFTLCLFLISGSAAYAAIDASIYQDGVNVVMEYSGGLNLADLTGPGNASINGGLHGTPSAFYIGAPPPVFTIDTYTGITGPSSFMSTGDFVDVDSGGADFFGLVAGGGVTTAGIYVDQGYNSGEFISNTAQFNNTTLATLGLTEGDYVWTWGSGATEDFVFLTIGNVPEPGAYALISALGVGAVVLVRRKRSR